MKILNVFNHYLERGGEAGAVEQICDSLSHVLDLRKCEFWSADWTGPGAPKKWKQALRIFRNPESLQKLRSIEMSFRPDAWLVHNILPVGSLAVYSEAKRLGVPIIQYVHNFRPFSVSGYLWAENKVALGGLSKNYWQEIRSGAWQDSHFKTAWLALVLTIGHAMGCWRSVQSWITISDFLREKFILAGIPAEKIFTLRHFWRPRADSSPKLGKHYLYLGRLSEAKGINVLLDAWQILANRLGLATPQLLIGGDGPLRSSVSTRSSQMQSVTYAGNLVDNAKVEALRNARAVIVPSISWEGLGLVVYEAYDYCRPVLVARSGGLSEIVVHGETGLLHEPTNAEQLASHVLMLEKDAEACVAMGTKGRSWLEQNASETQWQRRFCEIASYATGKRPRVQS